MEKYESITRNETMEILVKKLGLVDTEGFIAPIKKINYYFLKQT
ncbi:MAG: conserved hypothetical protein [Methanobrevibacter sp. CfCl-M3]